MSWKVRRIRRSCHQQDPDLVLAVVVPRPQNLKRNPFSSSGLLGAWYRQRRAVVQHLTWGWLQTVCHMLNPFVNGKMYRAYTRDMGGGETAQLSSGRAGGAWRGARRGAVARRRLHAVRVSGS